MSVPDDVKENIRAVLLSKTDGSGILVSQFFKDYKSFLQQPLVIKKYGYESLETFLKDIPDVCRLEYSDKHMAYRLYGITKPNTFVSSFVKKAAGTESGSEQIVKRKAGTRVVPTMDLNEKWEPNERGLFSLCFPSHPQLSTKEDVARKFTQVGEVAAINIIPKLTFVRYSDEAAAKKAIELWGDELRLQRAEERSSQSEKKPRENRDNRDRGSRDNRNNRDNRTERDNRSNRDNRDSRSNRDNRTERDNRDNRDNRDSRSNRDSRAERDNRTDRGGYNENTNNNTNKRYDQPRQSGRNETIQNNLIGSDEDWDDEPATHSAPKSKLTTTPPKPTAPGGYPNKKADVNNQPYSSGYLSSTEDSHRNSRAKDTRKMNTKQDGLLQTPPLPQGNTNENVEVYIGNWPNEAHDHEMNELLKPYKHTSFRMYTSKDNKVKKYAFVECETMQDAQVLINSLDKTLLHNRNLLVRLGKKAKTGNEQQNTGSHDRTMTDTTRTNSLVNDFDNMSVRQSGHSRRNKQPRHSKQQDGDDMPPLEDINPDILSPNMPHLEAHNDMPVLEQVPGRHRGLLSVGNTGRGQGDMPPLENTHRGRRGMPPLENTDRRGMSDLPRLPGDMPNLENTAPSMNNTLLNTTATSAQLNVGNFPYGTTERELADLFYPYGAHSIQIMNSDMTNRSTYAFVDFMDYQQAMNAMMTLDQSPFKGRKLVVTLSNTYSSGQAKPVPAGSYPRQPEPAGCYPRLDTPQGDTTLSQISPIARSEAGSTDSSMQNNQFSFRRLTNTLQDYSKIASKLRAEEHYQMVPGMQMKVIITHVENQKFFWGQILEDSENGKNQDLHSLQVLSDELQTEPKTIKLEGLGRCMAKYEDEWFRAWNTFETKKNGQLFADLIFIDYGNRMFLPRQDIYKTKPPMWLLPPMARPFKLPESKVDLESCVDSVVVLEILEPGHSGINFVSSVKAIKWSK